MRSFFRLFVSALIAGAMLTTTMTVPASAERETTKMSFRVTLTSNQRILNQVGADGSTSYGWNELVGTASRASGDVNVQMLGNVEYVNGSGPFFGFLNLQFPSQSLLGLSMDGRANRHRDGSTELRAKLRVIGGNASLATAKGTGTISGERREELGGAIDIKVAVRLDGVAAAP